MRSSGHKSHHPIGRMCPEAAPLHRRSRPIAACSDTQNGFAGWNAPSCASRNNHCEQHVRCTFDAHSQTECTRSAYLSVRVNAEHSVCIQDAVIIQVCKEWIVSYAPRRTARQDLGPWLAGEAARRSASFCRNENAVASVNSTTLADHGQEKSNI